MPPISKITADLLEEKLRARKGCVVEVADDLRISRNEVYRKIRLFGLDLDNYREVTYASEGVSSSDCDVTEPCNVTWRTREFAHKLGGMVEQAADVIADLGAEIKARHRKARAEKPRLLPEQEREIDDFRREMAACLNSDVTASDVAQQFHKRYFRRMVEDFRLVYARKDGEQ